MLSLLLLVVAVVLFGLAAFNAPVHARFNWVAGGLFFWALSSLVAGVRL